MVDDVPRSAHLTRLLLLQALGVFAGFAFFVPLSAMFHQDTLGWGVRAAIVGLTGLGVAAPLAGITALSLLLPMAIVIAPAFDWVLSPAQVSDACLLAVVSGASLRMMVRREPAERLAGYVLAFGAVVLTSVLVELHVLNVIAPQRPVWSEVWHHLTIDYWKAPREFPVLHDASRWFAGLALAVYAERAVRREGRPSAVVGVWILGGTVGALITVVQAATEARHGGLGIAGGVMWVLHTARLSALQPDVNAAGSYFALFLFPAVVVAWRRRHYWPIAISALLLTLAFTLARSRAAIGALVAVACVRWASSLRRGPMMRLAFGVAAATLGVTLALVAMTSRVHVSVGEATVVRVELAEAGLQAVKRHPVFGVGLGEYIARTRRFITPEMSVLRSFAPNGENAHNNYLQIMVELGVPAVLLFVGMMGSVVFAGWALPRADRSPEADGMTLGLMTFLVSALFGHPLLVPEVFGVFFLALGLSAGVTAPPGRLQGRLTRILPAIAGFYVISLAWRLW